MRVLSREGNSCDVRYSVELSLGFWSKGFTYDLRHMRESDERISWTYLGGEFLRDNRGYWELVRSGENKVQATYSIEVGLASWVPEAAIRLLIERSLPAMLKQFKRRAEGF